MRWTMKWEREGVGEGEGGKMATAAQVNEYTRERTSEEEEEDKKRRWVFGEPLWGEANAAVESNQSQEKRGGSRVCVYRALLCECVSHPPLLTLLNNVSHFHS